MIKKELICKSKDKVLNIISKENVSYQTANKILRKKDIKIDEKRIGDNLIVFPGQKITFFLQEENEIKFFDRVFEDENILIINKFKGIEVSSNENNSIEKILTLGKKTYFPINRLDRNTEGLVIFAKTKQVYDTIKKAQKKNEIKKSYLAEVVGQTFYNNEKIISYLLKDEDNSQVKIFNKPIKGSVKIETTLTTLNNSSGKTSLLLIEIYGGKTHQIRAQLSFLNHPIVGDGKYGKNIDNKKFKTKTQKLTAFKLNFLISDKNLSYLNNMNFEIKPSWLIKGEI